MDALSTLLAVGVPAALVLGAASTHVRWRCGTARARTVAVGWVAAVVAVAALTAAVLGVGPLVDLGFGMAVTAAGGAWLVLATADRAAVGRRVPAPRCGHHPHR